MNTEPVTVTACPECGHAESATLTDGTRLCLNCRHEWNPAEVPPARANPATADDGGEVTTTAPVAHDSPPAAVVAPQADESAEAPTGATDADEAGEAALEALVGTTVVLEGGQLATIAGFPDDDHAEVVIGAGTDTERTEVVSLADVERSVDAPVPVADVDDDTAEALAKVNMAVAGLVMRAGLSAIAGEYPDAELVTPATGWLPLDTEGLPAIEQGSAYAVAFLVHAFSLDREIVGAIADTLLTDAQQQPLKGGSQDDDNTSTDNGNDTGDDLAGDTAPDVHGVGDGGNPQ